MDKYNIRIGTKQNNKYKIYRSVSCSIDIFCRYKVNIN
jgi:hypothetical protein